MVWSPLCMFLVRTIQNARLPTEVHLSWEEDVQNARAQGRASPLSPLRRMECPITAWRRNTGCLVVIFPNPAQWTRLSLSRGIQACNNPAALDAPVHICLFQLLFSRSYLQAPWFSGTQLTQHIGSWYCPVSFCFHTPLEPGPSIWISASSLKFCFPTALHTQHPPIPLDWADLLPKAGDTRTHLLPTQKQCFSAKQWGCGTLPTISLSCPLTATSKINKGTH